MHTEYMRTWLKINIPHYSELWTDDEVVMAFFMLPLPNVAYPEWAEMVSGKPADEPVRVDPFTRLCAELGDRIEDKRQGA